MEADLTALPQLLFQAATGLALVRCLWHDLEEVEVVLEGSSEEAAAAVVVLAAGASTTLVVPRGYPSVLEAASELLLGVEQVVALAWEVVAAVDLVVVELVAVLDLVSVVEVVDMALVEALVGLALVVDREVVEGLALVE